MSAKAPLSATLRLSWPALLLCAAVLLPFLGKAFTIDDTLFLLQAQHLLVDPLHPTAFDAVWTDAPRRLSSIMPSGPIMAYLLLPSVLLGGAEWAAHLVQLGLLFLAIVSTVALALRLELGAVAARRAGLFIAVSPAVLGMAATAMPDVAAMAFAALFMERYIAWEHTRRRGALVGAALALAIGIATRSHLVLLCGVALVYAYRERLWGPWQALWPPPRAAIAPVAVGLLLTFFVLRLTGDPAPTSSGIVGAAQELYQLRFFPSNLVAFLSHWALSLPLSLPWAILRWQQLRLGALKYIVPVAALIIALTTSFKTVWVALIVGVSALALYDIVDDARKRRDALQLTLGLWVLLALPVAIYIHMPPKYLLVSVPAMAILLSRRLVEEARAPRMVQLIAVFGTILGVLIIRVDAGFAKLGKDAAQRLIAPRTATGERVWFAGHWGFQYYAMRAGGRSLTRTPPHPAPGELVVQSVHSQSQVLDEFPRRTLLSSDVLDAPGGRIMSRDDGAGFYSNGWGYLPYTLTSTRSEIERINVWRME